MNTNIIVDKGYGPILTPAISNTQAVFMHGMVGGFSSAMQGGDFFSGFISGAVGKATTVGIANNIDSVVGKGVVTTIAGGVAAELGGGKFANGAMTAAMGYLLNYLSSRARAEQRRRLAEQAKQRRIQNVEKILYSAAIFKGSLTVAHPASPGDDLIRGEYTILEEITLYGTMPACCEVTNFERGLLNPDEFLDMTVSLGIEIDGLFGPKFNFDGVLYHQAEYGPGDMCPVSCQASSVYTDRIQEPWHDQFLNYIKPFIGK